MTAQTQSMFFKSEIVSAHWDTWMYFHEGIFYLYYLITEHSPGEGFGLATSSDGVTWSDHGWVVRASDKMVTYLGTGAVWKASDFVHSGRFICNYSEWRVDDDGKETQNIFFAWSKDLMSWTKYGDESIFKVDRRWYDTHGRWDCIYPLPKADGGYYGYWTATPKEHVGIGFGESFDGLRWESLPAPALNWKGAAVPTMIEAGAVEKFGDKYYALIGLPVQAVLAIRTMIADHPAGPFRLADNNTGVMETNGSHSHTYFARFLQTPDGVLVNHHALTRFKNEHGRFLCHFAPLKEAVIDTEGTLWLIYWQGNEWLKRHPVSIQFSAVEANRVRIADKNLNAQAGIVLEGGLVLPDKAASIETWPGLYIACENGTGSGILVGGEGVTHFGLLNIAHGSFSPEDQTLRRRKFGETVQFRLLLKGSLLEFYLDDVYIQSYSMPAAATGQLGLVGQDSAVRDVRAWMAEK